MRNARDLTRKRVLHSLLPFGRVKFRTAPPTFFFIRQHARRSLRHQHFNISIETATVLRRRCSRREQRPSTNIGGAFAYGCGGLVLSSITKLRCGWVPRALFIGGASERCFLGSFDARPKSTGHSEGWRWLQSVEYCVNAVEVFYFFYNNGEPIGLAFRSARGLRFTVRSSCLVIGLFSFRGQFSLCAIWDLWTAYMRVVPGRNGRCKLPQAL